MWVQGLLRQVARISCIYGTHDWMDWCAPIPEPSSMEWRTSLPYLTPLVCALMSGSTELLSLISSAA